MNRKELEELIDSEVDKVMSSLNMREPQLEPESQQQTNSYVAPKRASISEEELDEILFYGGKKPEEEKYKI